MENPESPESARPSTAPPADQLPDAARNRVLALVHQFMSIWDRNSGDAAPLIDLLSPEGFTITLMADQQTMTTIAGVQAWYAGFPQRVRQVEHIVDSVDILPLTGDTRRVHTRVHTSGISTQGQAFLVRSDHLWEVVDYGGFVPRIATIAITIVRET